MTSVTLKLLPVTKFEYISQLFLVFVLLNLNKQMFPGCGISNQILLGKTCYNSRTKNNAGMKLELQTKHKDGQKLANFFDIVKEIGQWQHDRNF